LTGTVAANVLKHGTGAINVDACRVPCVTGDKPKFPSGNYSIESSVGAIRNELRVSDSDPTSRWPANFIHDGLTGGWSKFFYCPKAGKKDRGVSNDHPTVKPTDLMAYLCRLVTRPGGIVLDPFMGSGSTGKAAIREGFLFVGIEMDSSYVDISDARISNESK
jgi:site-specific DNA-methyltransferase (adenine-specific)